MSDCVKEGGSTGCGKPGCPVGLGIAAVFGALGSFFILKGKTPLSRLIKHRYKFNNSYPVLILPESAIPTTKIKRRLGL